MPYLPFARKYRPQSFSEVIGQDSVVEKLKQAILKGRIHHAYLFCGPRGVGKTSLARILAKSLNCQKGPTITPCGRCESCVAIQKGSSLDVVEIDGASNRGIDNIRELRENAKLAPASSRFKIYIIDEVHQITKDAFNALLKTLEEPPQHVKFIFATTEPQKVPLTIASRCQKFDFRLVSLAQIEKKLKNIAEKEGVKVDSRLIAYVGRAASGSIRDAESIFDQILPLVEQNYGFEQILDFLGDVASERIIEFLQSLFQKQTALALAVVDETAKEGYDLDVFLQESIEYLRAVILAQVDSRVFSQGVSFPPEVKEKIAALAKKAKLPQALAAIENFIEAKKTSRALNNLRIPLEVAIIKSSLDLQSQSHKRISSQPVNKTLAKNTALPSGSFSPAEKKSASEQKRPLKMEGISQIISNIRHKAAKNKAPGQNNSISKETAEEADAVSQTEAESVWEGVKEGLQKVKISLATALQTAEITSCQGRLITLGFAKNLVFNKELAEKKENKKLIENSFSQALGKGVRVECVFTDKILEENRGDSPDDDTAEILNNIVDTFGGEVVS